MLTLRKQYFTTNQARFLSVFVFGSQLNIFFL